MPLRLWVLVAALCLAIGAGSVLALYVGVQEVRLHRSGPRRQLLAEEIGPGTQGWVQVLACARHDLEVAIDSDGQVVTGARDVHDRLYTPLSPQSECDEDTPPERLHLYALLESSDVIRQGLWRLYDKGYRAPPTRVIVEGVMGFGAGDLRREPLARRALAATVPGARDLPLLVKDRRPGSRAAAYATVAVGVHGLVLLAALAFLATRRLWSRGLPPGFDRASDS